MKLRFENLFDDICATFTNVSEGSEPVSTWSLVKLKNNAKSVKPHEQQKVDNLRDSKKNIVVIGTGDLEVTKTGAREYASYILSSELTYGYDDVNSRVLVPASDFTVLKKDINLHPVSDEVVHKDKVHSKPKSIQSVSEPKFETNLTNKNTTIPNGNKWNDNMVGGGNTPKKNYTAKRS